MESKLYDKNDREILELLTPAQYDKLEGVAETRTNELNSLLQTLDDINNARDEQHREILLRLAHTQLNEFATANESVVKEVKEQLYEIYKKEAAAYTLDAFMDEIQLSKRAPFYSTGFESIDNILDGGLYAGLYVVGAISSLGKTTFCLQVMDNIAERGQDVLIFSLEMARRELMAKSISRLTLLNDIDSNQTTRNAKTTRGILTGKRYEKYSETEKKLITYSIDTYKDYAERIYISEGVGNIGVEQIKQRVGRHLKYSEKPPVVLVDYLQILAPYNDRATDKQNTDKAVLELKRLSRDYNVPVVAVSSFNRDNYTQPVNLSSFKESGAIEYSADVLIGLQYNGMDYKKDEKGKFEGGTTRDTRIRTLIEEQEARGKAGQNQSIQVKILKNRNGAKGSTVLDFYPMFNCFMNKDENTNKGAFIRL